MGKVDRSRGTFEQRKAQSILRHKEEEQKKQRDREEKEAAMTPEERESKRKAQAMLSTFLPIVVPFMEKTQCFLPDKYY